MNLKVNEEPLYDGEKDYEPREINDDTQNERDKSSLNQTPALIIHRNSTMINTGRVQDEFVIRLSRSWRPSRNEFEATSSSESQQPISQRMN